VSELASARFEALGSVAVVAVTDAAALADGRAAVQDTVSAFDHACSRFRDDSELTAVNAAAGEPIAAGPLLLEAVRAALRAAQLTEGDVDPTVGEALIALGYDRDFASLAAAINRHSTAAASSGTITVMSAPGWRGVELDPSAGTIRVPRGVKLDLGATAKALAADHAAVGASRLTGCGVLVGLGGDISLAGAAPPAGWPIRVTDDHRSGADVPGQWITLRSGGLATSSTTMRRWGSSHHLLDPRTGQSVDSVWRTVSVAAGCCLDANIASTAAIIRSERAVEWLESLRLPARLVSVEGMARHVGDWPKEGDDLA
jgi:thiamine biosynthesis lipoprotein